MRRAQPRPTNHLATLIVILAALAWALPSTAGAYLYWPNSDGGSIGRANEDGTGVDQSFISGLSISPIAVAADSGHVYWTTLGVNGPVNRAGIGGSELEEAFIPANKAIGVAVDGGHIYPVSVGTPGTSLAYTER